MKQLDLTEKHEAKLLEMCNKLFPKKGKWFEVLCGEVYYSKNGKFPGRSFHWFELCMTHLCYKIDHGDYVPQYKTSGKILNMHPVDYLYYSFKKQKL